MKTPEEIKRGLECCLVADDMCRCDECPYSRNGYNTLKCDIELGEDAIEFITMMENATDEWEMVAASPGAVEDMARDNAQKDERIRQLEREKADLLYMCEQAGRCLLCKHTAKGTKDYPCCDCRYCEEDLTDSYWEWSGLEEGEHA